VADRFDPPELLGVDVQELARPFALIAHDRRLRLERAQFAEPQATQNAADRRGGHRQLARERRAAQAVAPPVLDLSHALGRHLVSTAPRRRTPIVQRRRRTGAVARQPTVRLPCRQPSGAGGRAHRPAVLRDPLHQQGSTLRHQTRILVQVHPALPRSALTVSQPTA
jgi:hypothetical protein